MRTIPKLVIISVLVSLPLGCGSDTSDKKEWPYTFVDSKSEYRNAHDVMELWAYSEELDIEEFKEFCKEQYRNTEANRHYILVLFDSRYNAGFPDSPFTAMFGNEQHRLEHIRAVCEFNKHNNFARLTHYEDNAWSSTAQRESL